MGFMGTNRVSLADCTVLNISKLYKSTKKTIDKEYEDLTKEEFSEYVRVSLSTFSVNSQTFEYEMYESPLKNNRWYFKCPKCGRRTTRLFLPPEGYGYESKYLCKFCHNLKPKSTLMGPSRFYKNVYRPLKKLHDIEKKLEKSKWLPSEKIDAYLEDYRKIEEEMKKSSEYKLYEFKKKRGAVD